MDKTKAVIYALAQISAQADGQGDGYTQAGLDRLYEGFSDSDRMEAEAIAMGFCTELEKQGFRIVPS